jgi:hypothetical protein
MTSPSERPSFPPAVLEALRKGNKLEAIKLLRQAGKAGVVAKAPKQAAAANGRASVGAHAVTPARPIPGYIPHSHSGLSPGEVPRGGGQAGWIFVVIGALVAFFALS